MKNRPLSSLHLPKWRLPRPGPTALTALVAVASAAVLLAG